MMMPALAACGAACAALLYLRALQQPRSAITRLGGAAASSPFSHVVIHGGVAYLSGVTAQADGNGLTDKDTVEEQTRRTLAVIEQRLALAGTDKSRLLSCQIWLKDIARDFKAMNGEWNAWVDPVNKPVRATVESPLATPLMLVEIQVTAAIA